MSDGNIGDGLGDFEGIEGVIFTKPCIAIFKFLYLVDGFALIIIGGLALTGSGDFSGSKAAFDALIGAGCGMLLIGVLSCVALWTGHYNNSCLCIIYCLLVSAVAIADAFALYTIHVAGDAEKDGGQFTTAVDIVISITYILNAFGYYSVIRSNEDARECMKCLCGEDDKA
ncbi:uncharacterized protein [Amphiura filiformis]|uniref:uncharacterized protein n=1 Tax=Amphiura filiformis TaxID=82378 RepID=UPI003B216B10